MKHDALRDAVLAYTSGHCGTGGLVATEVPALRLIRGGRETSLEHAFHEPALIVVVAGSKDLMLGDARLTYGAGQYLVLSVGLPIVARVTGASEDLPYLALALTLDLRLINDLMDRIGRAPESAVAKPELGLFVGTLDPAQAGAILRLAALLENPAALRVLYPSLANEIFYWLLVGRDGPEIRRLATSDSHTQRIARAIDVMRAEVARSVTIERLAASANMSASSFHQHFKAVTSMSPLQFHKQLRLLEARRLMLSDGADVTRAAYHVGYESASQFSREYARMFGAPPRRDIAAFRSAAS